MIAKSRVFVSVSADSRLDRRQLAIKKAILGLIEQDFEPEQFHVSGISGLRSWSFAAADEVMARCQGALILGFIRWQFSTPNAPGAVATAYNHYEGALALSRELPTLIIVEEGVESQGIFYMGGGRFVVVIPAGADVSWLRTSQFRAQFAVWRDEVKARYQVFFGYCGAATDTANRITRYLHSLDVSVMDWQTDFRSGSSILTEIRRAATLCTCGLFLFTRDDPLVGNANMAAPRDNVIFETGYFARAHGSEKTLIIVEEGAKMPADLGGQIYLPLKDRADTSTIETKLRDFLVAQL